MDNMTGSIGDWSVIVSEEKSSKKFTKLLKKIETINTFDSKLSNINDKLDLILKKLDELDLKCVDLDNKYNDLLKKNDDLNINSNINYPYLFQNIIDDKTLNIDNRILNYNINNNLDNESNNNLDNESNNNLDNESNNNLDNESNNNLDDESNNNTNNKNLSNSLCNEYKPCFHFSSLGLKGLLRFDNTHERIKNKLWRKHIINYNPNNYYTTTPNIKFP